MSSFFLHRVDFHCVYYRITSFERWICRFDCAENLLIWSLLNNAILKFHAVRKPRNLCALKITFSSQLFHSKIVYIKAVIR